MKALFEERLWKLQEKKTDNKTSQTETLSNISSDKLNNILKQLTRII